MNATPPFPVQDPRGGPWQSWSATRFVLFIFLLLAADYLVQLIVYWLTRDLFLPVLLGNLLGVIVPCWYAARSGGGSLGRDFHLAGADVGAVAAAAVVALAALAPTSFLAELSARIHAIDPEWVRFYQDNLPGGGLPLALAAVTVVVFAPVAEELLFRGLIYRLARRSWGPWPAALVSALAFGLIHGEPWFLFGLIGLGVLLAYLYEATGSLLAAVIAHGVHNGLSLTLMIMQRDTIGEPMQPKTEDWILLGVSLVVLAVTIILLQRRGRHLDDAPRS